MPEPPSVLLVASSGGHLQELIALAARVVPDGYAPVWFTPAGPQADRLAEGATVHAVNATAPRDLRGSAKNLLPAIRVLRKRRPLAVVSTGAAIALPALGAARLLGVEAHYIESAARTDAPSLTGRLLAGLPGVHRYTQWPQWSTRQWAPVGSTFDGFSAVARPGAPLRRVVVTVGTQPGYGFRRLIERLIAILPPDVETVWQVGSTDVAGLGIDARRVMAPVALHEAMVEADVVVSHAGVGSALGALGAGRIPVLVRRELAFGEHVDDHQAQLAAAISGRGLAIARRVAELTVADLVEAAGRQAVATVTAPLRLGGRLGAALDAAREVRPRPG